MKEIVYYVAEDGTRFEDEEECRLYEERSMDTDCIVLLDGALKPVVLDEDGLECWIECAAYIGIVDAVRAKELFKYLVTVYGPDLPEDEIYNGDIWMMQRNGEWKEINRDFSKIRDAIGAVKQEYSKMQKKNVASGD